MAEEQKVMMMRVDVMQDLETKQTGKAWLTLRSYTSGTERVMEFASIQDVIEIIAVQTFSIVLEAANREKVIDDHLFHGPAGNA